MLAVISSTNYVLRAKPVMVAGWVNGLGFLPTDEVAMPSARAGLTQRALPIATLNLVIHRPRHPRRHNKVAELFGNDSMPPGTERASRPHRCRVNDPADRTSEADRRRLEATETRVHPAG